MKIVILGCAGKMGKTLANAAKNYSGVEIACGVDKNCCESDYNFPVFPSVYKITVKADVIIDFSHPSLLDSLLSYCIETRMPAVICTTGFSDAQTAKIKKAAETIPVFYSRNMSIGVSLILELSCRAARFLGSDFNIEIIEKHHNQKIDAPSGTALMIAEEISQCMDRKPEYIHNRTEVRRPRTENEIGIHSVRGGNICGDHEIMFAGKDETITLSHHAGSRDIFANGALKAARFLIGCSHGIYTMRDIIDNM